MYLCKFVQSPSTDSDEHANADGILTVNDIKTVRKEERKSYWKIPLCDDDATREK